MMMNVAKYATIVSTDVLLTMEGMWWNGLVMVLVTNFVVVKMVVKTRTKISVVVRIATFTIAMIVTQEFTKSAKLATQSAYAMIVKNARIACKPTSI
jgi:hypothetical protein